MKHRRSTNPDIRQIEEDLHEMLMEYPGIPGGDSLSCYHEDTFFVSEGIPSKFMSDLRKASGIKGNGKKNFDRAVAQVVSGMFRLIEFQELYPDYRIVCAYNSSNGSFTNKGNYSAPATRDAVASLVNKGVLLKHKGWNRTNSFGTSRLSAYELTPEGFKWVVSLVDVQFSTDRGKFIVMKDSKGDHKSVDFNSDRIKRRVTHLERYTDLVRGNSVTLPNVFTETNELAWFKGVHTPLVSDTLHIEHTLSPRRIFNNGSLHQGGRWYMLFQNMPRHMRASVRINGNPTVEYDYPNLHIRMLYALRGIHYTKDVYQIPLSSVKYAKDETVITDPKELRSIAKIAILVLINSPKKKPKNGDALYSYVKALESDMDGKYSYKVCRSVLVAMAKEHPAIADDFYTGKGVILQGYDSAIMTRVIAALTKKGILAIPVHDSAIVEEQHGELLKELMEKEYLKEMKFTITVDLK